MSRKLYQQPQGYSDPNQINIMQAEVINNNDPHQKNRFACRLLGHESDLQKIPDDQLQWATAMQPDTQHKGMGTNSRYVPGDKVFVLCYGNERIVLGAVQNHEDSKSDQADKNPWTDDGNASPKSPPPGKIDGRFGWGEKMRSHLSTTEEARKSTRKREKSKKEQGETETPNKYGNIQNRFGKDLSAGQVKFDNSQNPMEFIKSKIQNSGAVVPEMLEMVQTLKNKPTGLNPHAIQAVGAQNYMKFIQNLKKYFDKIKTKSQKKDQTEEEKEKEEEELAIAQQFENDPDATDTV